MDNYELLTQKVTANLEAFKDKYRGKEPLKVFEDWYAIAFYASYAEMLTSGFVQDNPVYSPEIDWLASFEKPLDALYAEWLSTDGELSLDWDDMLDFISQACRDARAVFHSIEENQQDSGTLYVITMSSGGGTVRDFATFSSRTEAEEICESYGWRFVDENGFEWGLDIDEREQPKALSDEELCFVDDEEKMRDFGLLSKDAFLASYSYLTEEEYDATVRVLAGRKHSDSLDDKVADATARRDGTYSGSPCNNEIVRE